MKTLPFTEAYQGFIDFWVTAVISLSRFTTSQVFVLSAEKKFGVSFLSVESILIEMVSSPFPSILGFLGFSHIQLAVIGSSVSSWRWDLSKVNLDPVTIT